MCYEYSMKQSKKPKGSVKVKEELQLGKKKEQPKVNKKISVPLSVLSR